MDKPFSYYIGLDGPHLDGLIGHAGLLRFDWPSKQISIEYYDGVSGGHNISIAANGKLGLLGNFSQQLVLVDLENMRELERQSTMEIEPSTYRLRSNTHHLWYEDNQRFIGAVGDNLYRFDINDLSRPQLLGPHKLFNAHELRWDITKRYILMGDLGPEDQPARQVGVFDLKTNESTVIKLPDTCWHVCVDPEKPLGYAATYSMATEGIDYVDWSPAFRREYVFEIDLEKKRVRRSWSSGAELPIHLNADIGVYGDRLYLASGGSHTVVELNLDRGRVQGATHSRLSARPLEARHDVAAEDLQPCGRVRPPAHPDQHAFDLADAAGDGLAHHGRHLLRPHLARWQVPRNRKPWVQRTDCLRSRDFQEGLFNSVAKIWAEGSPPPLCAPSEKHLRNAPGHASQ